MADESGTDSCPEWHPMFRRFREPAPEDRFIGAAGNFEDQRLLGSIQRKVGVDALSQLSGINSDNIIRGAVVGIRPSKNLSANLLFVDFRASLLE